MKEDNCLPDPGRTRPNADAKAGQDRTSSRRLVSLTEAAEMLGMSTASVRRLVGSGTLHIVRLTRRLLVDIKDLDRLIEQSKDRGFWR